MNAINEFHADLWQVTFSNVPTISTPDELDILERFVKGCNLPEYGVDLDQSTFNGYEINHPIAPKFNNDLSLLQIEFKLSENLKNYLYLFEWIQNIRYGLATSPVRKYWCDEIMVRLLDNQKRTTGRFTFTHAFCVALSALPLTVGTSEEITFVANFDYENLKFTVNSDLDDTNYD